MPTAVDILVVNDDPSPTPVSGVAMVIYNAGTLTQVTTGTTDSDGTASFLLPDGSYDVRFFKTGVSILPKQPQRIVVDHTLSNIFKVVGHEITQPESIDPKLCRVTGYLLSSIGEPILGIRLALLPNTETAVFTDGAMLPQQIVEVVSDQDTGYFDFNLLRGLQYEAAIPLVEQLFGEPVKLSVVVPDLPAAKLDTILFPLPVQISLSDTIKSIALHDGPNSDVTSETTYSDGSQRTQPPPWTGIKYTYTDDSIFTISISNGVVTIIPLKAGTATVSFSRVIQEGAYWQDPPDFSADTLTVTVT